ncbi:MAG TPA: hypothetical protein VEK78_01000 [Gemmatimonadales bacterium]|nr:hypothetical protein [Gemmatimonadales bacterium]
MKKAAGLRIVCVAAALFACTEGRTIITVDVLSFLRASGLGALSYDVRGGVAQTDVTASRLFSLPPRFRQSSVDSVEVTAGAILKNTAGGGSVVFDVFFAKQEAGLFSGTPYISASSTVSGVQTDTLLAPTTVSLGDTVFNAPDLWVGIRARLATDPGPNMAGQLELTVLGLRVVLQDRGF